MREFNFEDVNGYYILVGHKVVPERNLLRWADWHSNHKRSLAKTSRGPVVVSTVFLGVDHNFTGEGPPMVFETMIFGGRHDEMYQTRCAFYEDALIMHEEAVRVAFPPWWQWPWWQLVDRCKRARFWWVRRRWRLP